MRILYVTPLWGGFKDLIYGGKSQATGMPAFIGPLRRLVELGNEIDCVVAARKPECGQPLHIGVPWLSEAALRIVPWSHKGLLSSSASLIRLWRTVTDCLKNKKYDFVYGHGSVGAVGCMCANRRGIRTGGRAYGTMYANSLLEKSRLNMAIRHPLEYGLYAGRKHFLLATNDGTRGDVVYNSIVKKPHYKFHFLRNGVEFPEPDRERGGSVGGRPYLLFPARIAPWKQQHLGVEILHRLQQMGHTQVQLRIAGGISSEDYFEKVRGLARDYGLEQNVIYVGSLTQKDLLTSSRNALAVLSLYRISNLGNVVIEALTAGSTVLALNDHSLDELITDGENGILVDGPDEAARRIEELMLQPELTESIRRKARDRAKETFLSWEDRIEIEIGMIYDAVSDGLMSDQKVA